MITFYSRNYSTSEMHNLLALVTSVCDEVKSAENCHEFDAHCPTCENRHLCADMHLFKNHLQYKLGSETNHA